MKGTRNYVYDEKCYELAAYFFGADDPRLPDIAQDIQDTVEQHPERGEIEDGAFGFRTVQGILK